jgi:hypothetical protein
LDDYGAKYGDRPMKVFPDVGAHEGSSLKYFRERDVMVGDTHRARVQNWLRVAGAERRSPRLQALQVAYVVAEAVHGRREALRTALVPHR